MVFARDANGLVVRGALVLPPLVVDAFEIAGGESGGRNEVTGVVGGKKHRN